MPTRITLHLGGSYGTLSAEVEADWTTGAVRYEVAAPRVAGVFVLRPTRWDDDPIPRRVTVEYGDGPEYANEAARTNRPVVNGVQLCGAVVVDPSQPLTRWGVNARRSTGPYTSEPVPEATAERTAAVVRALVTHWNGRPDRREIQRAAARHDAPGRLARERDEVKRLRGEADEIAAKLEHHVQRVETFVLLAAEGKRCAAGPPRGATSEDASAKAPPPHLAPAPSQEGPPEEAGSYGGERATRVREPHRRAAR